MKKYLAAFALALLASGVLAYHYAKADIYGSSLILWYTFDSNDISGINVTDYSGNANTGTAVNSPTLTAGTLGQALLFNGSNQYITFTDPSTLTLSTATSPFTFSIWFKTSALNGAILILRSTSAVTSVFDIVVGNDGAGNANTGKPAFIIRASNNTGLTQVISNTVFSDGSWHMLTVTRTSAHLNTMYVDGSKVGSATDAMTAGLLANVAGSAIGKEPVNTGIPLFNGSLDSLRIYNRDLSASEIQQLYYNTRGSHGYSSF